MEKNFHYEASVNLKNMSDRDEAVELINWVIRELRAIPNRSGSQDDDLKEAEEVLESWK